MSLTRMLPSWWCLVLTTALSAPGLQGPCVCVVVICLLLGMSRDGLPFSVQGISIPWHVVQSKNLDKYGGVVSI